MERVYHSQVQERGPPRYVHVQKHAEDFLEGALVLRCEYHLGRIEPALLRGAFPQLEMHALAAACLCRHASIHPRPRVLVLRRTIADRTMTHNQYC